VHGVGGETVVWAYDCGAELTTACTELGLGLAGAVNPGKFPHSATHCAKPEMDATRNFVPRPRLR
jgi:hypothetical protein